MTQRNDIIQLAARLTAECFNKSSTFSPDAIAQLARGYQGYTDQELYQELADLEIIRQDLEAFAAAA